MKAYKYVHHCRHCNKRFTTEKARSSPYCDKCLKIIREGYEKENQ